MNFQKRIKVTTPLKVIDSSTLPLNLTNHKWTKTQKTKAGVKLYLLLVFMEEITNAIKHCFSTIVRLFKCQSAIKYHHGQLEVLIAGQSCMYEFDRGYLNMNDSIE